MTRYFELSDMTDTESGTAWELLIIQAVVCSLIISCVWFYNFYVLELWTMLCQLWLNPFVACTLRDLYWNLLSGSSVGSVLNLVIIYFSVFFGVSFLMFSCLLGSRLSMKQRRYLLSFANSGGGLMMSGETLSSCWYFFS